MKHLLRLVVSAVTLLGSATAGFTQDAHADRSSSSVVPRIIFGNRISTRGSPVVQVRRANGSASSLCTGSVIARNVVLTAWHCVGRRAASMSVVVNGKRIGVARVRAHPSVRVDGDGAIYNDIALLYLKTKVSVAPLPLLLSKSIAVGDSIRIAGFGLTELQTVGALMEGYASVDAVTEDFVITLFDSQDSNSCSGDSGGPAIATYTDASGAVHSGIVGTTSTGSNEYCFYGDRTNYINIQSPVVSSFILRNVPGATIQ